MKPSSILATLLFLLSVFALAQTRPEFEVATIKLNTSGGRGGRIEMPPNGRLTVNNVPLRMMITEAYNIKNSQIFGAPDWLGTERYDIAAKAEGKASQEQIRLMLQPLLADRLKLSVHRETKETQVYELIPAKGGLKLTPTTEGSCQKFDRDHPPALTPGGPMPDICGNMSLSHGQLTAWGMPMERFTGALSTLLDRPVIDKTGSTGTYNIRLEFTPDRRPQAAHLDLPAESGDAPPPDSASPNIFTALQKQLGIKAESAKAPIEMLVIDHVERPSEN